MNTYNTRDTGGFFFHYNYNHRSGFRISDDTLARLVGAHLCI